MVRNAVLTDLERLSRLDPRPLDVVEQAFDRRLVEIGDALGQQVGELGRLGAEAGGVDDDLRVRNPGEAFELFRLVPDDVEILAYLVDQHAARPAAPAVLERRQIGRRQLQLLGHPLEGEAALGAQLAHFFAERSHRGAGSAGSAGSIFLTACA